MVERTIKIIKTVVKLQYRGKNDGKRRCCKKNIEIVKKRGISQYKLEKASGLQHGSMQCIMNGRNKTVTLTTVYMLARGFNISLLEFLDDEVFRSVDIEIY